jgi:hypothetical protein
MHALWTASPLVGRQGADMTAPYTFPLCCVDPQAVHEFPDLVHSDRGRCRATLPLDAKTLDLASNCSGYGQATAGPFSSTFRE